MRDTQAHLTKQCVCRLLHLSTRLLTKQTSEQGCTILVPSLIVISNFHESLYRVSHSVYEKGMAAFL